MFTLAALAMMSVCAMAQWTVKIGIQEYPMTKIEGSNPETYTATVTCEVPGEKAVNFYAQITDGTNTSNAVTTTFTLTETKDVQFWGQYPKGKSWIAGLCSEMEYPIANAGWMYLCVMPTVAAAADAQTVTYFNEPSAISLKSALNSKAPSDVRWITAGSTGNPPFAFDIKSNNSGIKKIALNYATWKVTVEAAETIDVTIGTSGSTTLCAPADLTIPAGVMAYTLDYDGTAVKATEVTTTIPANTPVLLTGGAGTYSFAIVPETTNILTDTYSSKTYMTDAASGNLYGVNMPHYVPVGSYVLSDEGEAQVFTKVESDKVIIKPFTAYLTVQDATEDAFTVSYDVVPTDIKTVANGQRANGECYNLNGQRVASDFRGLVVKNGRKVVVK